MLVYDPTLTWAALLLLSIGVVMVYSASIAIAEASAYTGYRPWYFLARHALFVVAGLAAGLIDVQAGVEVGLEVAENGRDLVRSGSFSHGSLPGSLPVIRFPLRLDQILGGRPVGAGYTGHGDYPDADSGAIPDIVYLQMCGRQEVVYTVTLALWR